MQALPLGRLKLDWMLLAMVLHSIGRGCRLEVTKVTLVPLARVRVLVHPKRSVQVKLLVAHMASKTASRMMVSNMGLHVPRLHRFSTLLARHALLGLVAFDVSP